MLQNKKLYETVITVISKEIKKALNENNNVITGRYYIADCEHEGDINQAIYYIQKLGGKVTGQYWDGDDCGEAYLDIEVDPELFKKLYNHVQSFRFNADIRDYVETKDGEIEGYKNVPYKKLKQMQEKAFYDCSDGFEKRLTIYVKMFDISPDKAKQHIEKLLEVCGKGSRVMGVSYEMSSDNYELFDYFVLIKLKGVTVDKLSKLCKYNAYYDMFNPHRAMLHPNRGDIDFNHIMYRLCSGVDRLFVILYAIKEKKPLWFRQKYGSKYEKLVPYEEYMATLSGPKPSVGPNTSGFGNIFEVDGMSLNSLKTYDEYVTKDIWKKKL